MGRPIVAKLDRERIRRAALELVDAEGLAGLSMRRLAAALDVTPPSLYFHYPTKDALLEAVAADVLGEVDTTAFAQGWATGLWVWAHSLRSALGAHPHLVPILSQTPGRRADALQRAEDVYGGLVDDGWPPREATMIGAAAKYLVFGAAMGSFATGFAADPTVYAGRYPHLQGAHRLAAHAAEIDSDSFDFALSQLIDGLRARYAATVTRPRAHRGRDLLDGRGVRDDRNE